MCGIFRFSWRGEIFSTSPAIQLNPSVMTCSLPRLRKQPDDVAMRQRRRFRKRLARYVPGWRRRAPIDRQLIIAEGALFGRPSLEETPFGGLPVVSHHDVELTPFASR